MGAAGRVRRWIGAVAFLAAAGAAVWIIPRLGTRSPVTILTLCALAVLTMRLVEHRVHRWFQRWAERETARTPPPEARS